VTEDNDEELLHSDTHNEQRRRNYDHNFQELLTTYRNGNLQISDEEEGAEIQNKGKKSIQ
jgi:hypothetical protein